MELEWAIAHFPSLSHDTMHCIVTQQGHQATIQPSDACWGGHDTVGHVRHTASSARADRCDTAGGGATIRRRERRDTALEARYMALCAMIRCAKRCASHGLRHGAPAARGCNDTTGGACHTVGPGLRHSQARLTTRRSACAARVQYVHIMHLT